MTKHTLTDEQLDAVIDEYDAYDSRWDAMGHATDLALRLHTPSPLTAEIVEARAMIAAQQRAAVEGNWIFVDVVSQRDAAQAAIEAERKAHAATTADMAALERERRIYIEERDAARAQYESMRQTAAKELEQRKAAELARNEFEAQMLVERGEKERLREVCTGTGVEQRVLASGGAAFYLVDWLKRIQAALQPTAQAEAHAGNDWFEQQDMLAKKSAAQAEAKPDIRALVERAVAQFRGCMKGGNQGHYGYAADALERYVLGGEEWPWYQWPAESKPGPPVAVEAAQPKPGDVLTGEQAKAYVLATANAWVRGEEGDRWSADAWTRELFAEPSLELAPGAYTVLPLSTNSVTYEAATPDPLEAMREQLVKLERLVRCVGNQLSNRTFDGES